MRLGFGVGTIDVGFTGGVSDAADGGLLSSTFLSNYGPYGMVMDFTDASISINDETDVLDYSSQGTVSATTGALLGPGSKLTYTAPSLKFTEQADGFIAGQAHNLYLNSATPANQSITVISGATYAITITGSVSITLSGAATGTVTAGTTTFTAASGTLTCGSTSGSGTVHVRRTPSVSTYVATTSAAVYDLPYVYSSGVKTGILVEPAATNLALRSIEFDNVTNWSDAAGTLAFGSGSVANAVTSVFGTVTADKVVPDTSSSSHVLRQVITYTSGTTYTQSLIVSSAGYNYVQLVFPAPLFSATAQANFDLATGVVGTVGAGVTASIEDLGSGIYRVVATCTATGSGGLAAGPCFISSATSARTETWTPDGTSGLYFHHYQMEIGTVATSPIITYGGTVLRALDNIYIATSLFPYSATTCFLYGEMITPVGGFQNNSTIIGLTLDGVAGTGPSAYVQASSTNSVAAWNSGSLTKNYLSSPTAGSTQKMAACFNTSGTLAAATNQGQAVATSAASAWNGTGNRLQIGGLSAFGVQNARAVTSRIMFLPEYDTAKAAAVTA